MIDVNVITIFRKTRGRLPVTLGFLVLCGLMAAQSASSSNRDDSTVAAPHDGGTMLRDNDLIRITVFQEDDLTTESRISKTGYITFPLIGSVYLAGKSVDEATEEIRFLLNKDYIINPHVTLTVLEYAKQWVTVLGEVQKPGNVEIPPEGGLDLLGAIALAGGYTKIAEPSHVTVRRQVNGKDVIIKVNAKDLAKDTAVKPFYVLPGDSVSVAQSIF